MKARGVIFSPSSLVYRALPTKLISKQAHLASARLSEGEVPGSILGT